MIQIDMPMPENCLDCPACNEYLMCAIPCNGRGWGENDVKGFSQSRPEWCPLKEQEAVEPIEMQRMDDNFSFFVPYFLCGNCRYELIGKDVMFCSHCGRSVKLK